MWIIKNLDENINLIQIIVLYKETSDFILNIKSTNPDKKEQVINHNDDSYFACDPDNLVDLRQFRDRLSQQKSKREQYKNDLEEKIQAVGRQTFSKNFT